MTPAPVSLSDRVARLEQAVKEIRASLALRRGERQRFVMQGAQIVPVPQSLQKDPETEFDTALADSKVLADYVGALAGGS